MPHDPKKILHDIKEAAERITRYVGQRTFDDFLADDYFRSAVERQFEIIGEAMTRLRKDAPEIASRISNQNKISGFRNALIHGYDDIDHKITWNVILSHLPILWQEVDQLLMA
jgi:uncharacterized protein with HEPN domain